MPRSLPGSLTAIFPGSFDPLTNGHLDLIARGSRLADHLIVAVLANSQKQPLFSVSERVAMLEESTRAYSNIEVQSFDGLLVEFAAECGAHAILRGVRTLSDCENEFQMAALNRRLRPETETIFLMAGEEYSFVSSRMIKEIASLGGDVSSFVPESVAGHLGAKFPAKR